MRSDRKGKAGMIARYQITDRAEWLRWRQQDVTASDVAALFGDFHPWRSIRGLYEEKRGDVRDDIDHAVLRRGRIYEKVAIDLIREVRPDWLIEKSTSYIRDPDHRIGATPDCIVVCPERGRGVLQIKTVAPGVAVEKWKEDLPPPYIVLQTATEMMLEDVAWGCVGALIIDPFRVPPPLIVDIPRHKAAEAKIVAAVDAFWKMVEEGHEPPLDYARDGDLVAAMYAVENPDKVLDLQRDNRVAELLDEREGLASALKTASDRKGEIDTELKAKIGEAAVALCPGGRKLTWKTRKAYTANVPASRVLRVGKAKE